ncbi:hypothetical protein F383_24984 [Gossypium arboreum]|uniref:Uncharacterized protein n=1 Tax=Gossypium arboreum TaxID=29729 RepID=A0A0B0MTX2_GOSAR|nr:hypothetical protein F383_24984 [Gossypium arboreum]
MVKLSYTCHYTKMILLSIPKMTS